jgi:UDP-glucose 4-epimerase
VTVTDLIIGGSGFVGRNFARRLEIQGRDVVILDRNLDATESSEGRFIQGDAQDAEFLKEVLTQVRPVNLYHLAANSDISAGVADASLDFGDTLMTTVAVRAAVSAVSVDRLVFASSSAIFGMSETPLGEESDRLPAPVSWYGKAKLASEYIFESLSAVQPGLSILMVRFPNVVGPLATHGVVYDFVRKLKANPFHLDVLGDGNQTKPYVHVAELINGIQYFADRLKPGVTRVNIGPPDLVSVREIVVEVCEALQVEPQVSYQDSPYGWPGDVPRYEFDTSKMRREGFAIDTSSRQAVRQAAEDLAREWATL